MAKKSIIKAARQIKKIPVKTDIGSVEEETIRRVDRTITTIEDFIARWDASKIKPDDLFPQIVKIRQFHEALLGWQRDALKARGQTDQEGSIRRLRDFVLICRTYS